MQAIPVVPSPSLRGAFAHRSAFLVNHNARAVSDGLIERLAAIVPAGDLFLSRTLEDAEVFSRTLARRGYGQVFLGGGDGTLVATMNLLRRASAGMGVPMPAIGVLRLGTGNAMAKALGAMSPVVDASHVVHQGPSITRPVDFVQTEDGVLTPFAGMGWDGAVLNDYVWLKDQAKGASWTRNLAQSVAGYLGAAFVRTIPNELRQKPLQLRIRSKQDAIFMRPTPHGDVEERLPAGTTLFEGPAATVCVGSIPYFGFGFTMFPFAMKKPGYVQLRVVGASIPAIVKNLWPAVWRGT